MRQILLFLATLCGCCHADVQVEDTGINHPEWDDRGYLIFCLCMGRFGNQVDHFLGGLAFAKSVDRTLILPPWRTYKNVRFTDWFDLETISQYHRVTVAEDFMEYLAPIHWPPDNRTGFCFSYNRNSNCDMKQGNPFGPFWDGLGIDFVSTITYDTSYDEPTAWKERFPADEYPVVALKGAPAPFPVKPVHQYLQKYLHWSTGISQQGDKYISDNFAGQKFIGIHLRNGPDWEKACRHAIGEPTFMASPQCLDPASGRTITSDLCLPSTEEILRLTHVVVKKTGAKVIYVATDKNPLIQELTDHLKDEQVQVFHQDPWLPQIDLYILGQSDHFIGNCISSFTSFVARERQVAGKETSFYGIS